MVDVFVASYQILDVNTGYGFPIAGSSDRVTNEECRSCHFVACTIWTEKIIALPLPVVVFPSQCAGSTLQRLLVRVPGLGTYCSPIFIRMGKKSLSSFCKNRCHLEALSVFRLAALSKHIF